MGVQKEDEKKSETDKITVQKAKIRILQLQTAVLTLMKDMDPDKQQPQQSQQQKQQQKQQQNMVSDKPQQEQQEQEQQRKQQQRQQKQQQDSKNWLEDIVHTICCALGSTEQERVQQNQQQQQQQQEEQNDLHSRVMTLVSTLIKLEQLQGNHLSKFDLEQKIQNSNISSNKNCNEVLKKILENLQNQLKEESAKIKLQEIAQAENLKEHREFKSGIQNLDGKLSVAKDLIPKNAEKISSVAEDMNVSHEVYLQKLEHLSENLISTEEKFRSSMDHCDKRNETLKKGLDALHDVQNSDVKELAELKNIVTFLDEKLIKNLELSLNRDEDLRKVLKEVKDSANEDSKKIEDFTEALKQLDNKLLSRTNKMTERIDQNKGKIKGIQEVQELDKKTLEKLKKALETLEDKQKTDNGESLERNRSLKEALEKLQASQLSDLQKFEDLNSAMKLIENSLTNYSDECHDRDENIESAIKALKDAKSSDSQKIEDLDTALKLAKEQVESNSSEYVKLRNRNDDLNKSTEAKNKMINDKLLKLENLLNVQKSQIYNIENTHMRAIQGNLSAHMAKINELEKKIVDLNKKIAAKPPTPAVPAEPGQEFEIWHGDVVDSIRAAPPGKPLVRYGGNNYGTKTKVTLDKGDYITYISFCRILYPWTGKYPAPGCLCQVVLHTKNGKDIGRFGKKDGFAMMPNNASHYTAKIKNPKEWWKQIYLNDSRHGRASGMRPAGIHDQEAHFQKGYVGYGNKKTGIRCPENK